MKKIVGTFLGLMLFTTMSIARDNTFVINSAKIAVENELRSLNNKKEDLCLSVSQAILMSNIKTAKENLSVCGEFASKITFDEPKVYSMAVCGKVFGEDIIGNPIESDYIYVRTIKDFHFNYKGKKSFYYNENAEGAKSSQYMDSMFAAMSKKYCK